MTDFCPPEQNRDVSKVLTIQDLVNMLQVSRRTIQRWRDQGKLSFIKIGRKIFFRADDIEAFLERHKLEAFAEVNNNFLTLKVTQNEY